MSHEQLFDDAREGNLIELGQLVGSGAGLSVTDSDGMTALMHAAANDHYKEVGLLVGSYDSNINARDNTGETALMHACAVGGHKIVKLLPRRVPTRRSPTTRARPPTTTPKPMATARP